MRPAPAPRHRLYLALADYLRARGVTVRHADLDGDGHWSANTRTLTLRAGAQLEDRITVLYTLATRGSRRPIDVQPRLAAVN